MKRSQTYILAGLAAFVVLGFSLSSTARFHVKCDGLAMTSSLERRFEVDIAPSRMREFNERVVSYLQNKGYTFESSESSDFLSVPDENLKQVRYTNLKTIGCDYQTIIWSENPAAENEFVVTVHRTVFGTTKSTEQAIADLEKIIATS